VLLTQEHHDGAPPMKNRRDPNGDRKKHGPGATISKALITLKQRQRQQNNNTVSTKSQRERDTLRQP
jgi:hypothetical protein